MADYYPPVGFHFSVSFTDLGSFEDDIKFQSVSGLTAQIDTETVKEGGENRFEHTLPLRSKYNDLVLKRGIFKPGQSGITDWCIQTFKNLEIQPVNLQVILLNEEHDPLMVWQVIHAWPKNWKVADLNAEKGEVLIETLELSYNRFEFKES